MTEQPPCPECNSTNVISKGTSWYCKDCGRWWLKITRGSKKTTLAIDEFIASKEVIDLR